MVCKTQKEGGREGEKYRKDRRWLDTHPKVDDAGGTSWGRFACFKLPHIFQMGKQPTVSREGLNIMNEREGEGGKEKGERERGRPY